MADLKKEYNLRESDVDPFRGTNLDHSEENVRGDDNEYATYKNTTYTHDGEKWAPNTNVKGGDYHNGGIRRDMDKTVNIKIYQSAGAGTSINSQVFDVHDKRDNKAVQVKPIEYTPNDNVEKEELNIGNTAGYAEGYEGEFDKRMELVTTSDNQMTYRSYKGGENDIFTDMEAGIPDDSSQAGDGTVAGTTIEAGGHFNRGNDTTDDKVDRNSSKVLDKSMFLNNYNSDVLELRGGSGIEIKDRKVGYKE